MSDTPAENLSERFAREDSYGAVDPRWHEKMVHVIPEMPTVDRVSYCCAKLKGKTVLSLGCTGPMQDAVDSVAETVYGVDIQPLNRDNFSQINLDRHPEDLPKVAVDIIFAGETFEHLSNPGNVLAALRGYECPLLATVPNAFATGAMESVRGRRVECVNSDHVAWYSWWTFTNLLSRYGWRTVEFRWYNGQPRVAEGLIVLAEM